MGLVTHWKFRRPLLRLVVSQKIKGRKSVNRTDRRLQEEAETLRYQRSLCPIAGVGFMDIVHLELMVLQDVDAR